MFHVLPANNVHVQVVDGLSAVRASVNDQAVAAFIDSFLFCDFTRDNEQVTEQAFVFGRGLVDRGDVLVRDNEHMGWPDGMQVAEGGYALVLIKHSGWGLSGGNFTEDAG